MKLQHLQLWIDRVPREAALQMALDEALFQETVKSGIPMLRIYQWRTPAVTFGYFGNFPEKESRPAIRRITGGGLVEHGGDVTFCLTLPSGSALAGLSTEKRYRWIHECFFDVIRRFDFPLQWIEDSPSQAGPCFSTPVKWDLADPEGTKIIGGAQRKSRGAVIHQGSARLPAGFQIGGENEEWMAKFAGGLSAKTGKSPIDDVDRIVKAAEKICVRKYRSRNWNRDRIDT